MTVWRVCSKKIPHPVHHSPAIHESVLMKTLLLNVCLHSVHNQNEEPIPCAGWWPRVEIMKGMMGESSDEEGVDSVIAFHREEEAMIMYVQIQ